MNFRRSIFDRRRAPGPAAPLARIPEPRPQIVEVADGGAFALVVEQLEAILRNDPRAKSKRARIEIVIQVTNDPENPPPHIYRLPSGRVVRVPAIREYEDFEVFWASAWRSSLDGGQPISREKGIPYPTTADLEDARRRAGAQGARSIQRFNVQQR